MMRKSLCLGVRALAAVFIAASTSTAVADVINFEDLTLAPGSHWNGPDLSGTTSPGPFGGTQYTGQFTTGGASFVNRFEDAFGSWSGFAYSNETNTTTAGFGNQFSSFAGADQTPTGNGVFGVAFGYVDALVSPTLGQLAGLPFFTAPAGMLVTGAYLTNTTFAALSMQTGDMFAKKFGGASGNDPDYLRVRAYGVDSGGNVLANTAEFYLSDFRFAENSQDYILDSWEWFDLTSLTGADRIYFNLETTDVGAFGSNTPTYFAIDDIGLAPAAVPEPSSIVLALVAAAGWRLRAGRRRRGRKSSRQAGAGNPMSSQGTGPGDEAGVVTR